MRNWNWARISLIAAIEIVFIEFVAAFFMPGGDDLYRYYQPFAAGCLDCGFVPYYARWVLFPLAWIPYPFTWPAWVLISGLLLVAAGRALKVNPALMLLTFPAIGQFWLGQVDALVVIGLVLTLLASHPVLQGVGIFLALSKPQLALFPLLVLWTHPEQRRYWKAWIIPGALVLLSLLIYGFDWPLRWVANANTNLPLHHWGLAVRDLFPWALVLLPVPWLFRERRERLEISLLVASLAMPFFSVYSYVLPLSFANPWWAIPFSYAWFLAKPQMGLEAMRLAWMLPAALLAVRLAPQIQAVWRARAARRTR
jgi:hypothetical protein